MRSLALVFVAVLLGCQDTRDWTKVAEVAGRLRCGMSEETIHELCEQFGAAASGQPTVKVNTPQYYCAAGDTFISFWLRDDKLHSYQIGDYISQTDGATGSVDGIVNLCREKQPGEAAPIEKRPN